MIKVVSKRQLLDLRLENANYRPLNSGKYELTATISAKRFKTLPSGREEVLGINEPIKIAYFDKHPKEMGKTEMIFYSEVHQIKDSLTTIRIVVDALPKYISVDPFLTRLDRNYTDNFKVIEAE